MPQTTLDNLIAARELISDPDRWAQHFYARTPTGAMVFPDNPGAVRWCAYGACMKVPDFTSDAINELDKAATALDFPTAALLNDALSTTHADVLHMFDLAIERVTSRAAS